jgi:WD40 repeat protein
MEMTGHLEPVRCLALSPDDQFLFSGAEDATIKASSQSDK